MRLLSASLLMVGLVFCSGVPTTVFAQPSLQVVGGERLDWGRIRPAVTTHTVTIKNIGTDTLRIVKVQPSCGCTTAPMDKYTLAPQDSGILTISVDLKEREGEQRKSIEILSNDLKQPTVILTIRAFVIQTLFAYPSFFPPVEGIKMGKEYVSSLELQNRDTVPITIYPPSIRGDSLLHVRVDFKKRVTLKPMQRVKVNAYVTPYGNGALGAEIEFPTNNPKIPGLKLRHFCSVPIVAATK